MSKPNCSEEEEVYENEDDGNPIPIQPASRGSFTRNAIKEGERAEDLYYEKENI
jgi:hypothetical protein